MVLESIFPWKLDGCIIRFDSKGFERPKDNKPRGTLPLAILIYHHILATSGRCLYPWQFGETKHPSQAFAVSTHPRCFYKDTILKRLQFVLQFYLHYFNPFATRHAYMRQLFHCLQWYAGSERVKIRKFRNIFFFNRFNIFKHGF